MPEIPFPLIVEARKRLTRCWVWTLINSLILLLPMSTVGVLGILLTPLSRLVVVLGLATGVVLMA